MANWYDKHVPKLNAGAHAEIKELYDGSACLVSYLARIYKVDPSYMRYVCNHDGYRYKSQAIQRKWQRNNQDWKREYDRIRGKAAVRRYVRRQEIFIDSIVEKMYLTESKS